MVKSKYPTTKILERMLKMNTFIVISSLQKHPCRKSLHFFGRSTNKKPSLSLYIRMGFTVLHVRIKRLTLTVKLQIVSGISLGWLVILSSPSLSLLSSAWKGNREKTLDGGALTVYFFFFPFSSLFTFFNYFFSFLRVISVFLFLFLFLLLRELHE